ncbi:TonB-dependent siderophore receptor [Pleionea sp. CnH1-48]|uniref:TonB-dependent receptor plug domain-containing protein n=1 Tax=Pleionea sp. CnH1-48 TaxID=2954494 RepID=UPI002097CAD4|nr:TonB-dependent receptor [Pleionea sp. CnH1-48]MCO7226443.1 TonB-dependent receptor [Pleionea sp. CnH1-48]
MKKKKPNSQPFWIKASVLAIASAIAFPTFAEEEEAEKKEDEEDSVKVVVVGSRSSPRSVGESAVPVDIITGDEFTSQGITDMNSMLAVSVPSYNVNAQPISDAATLVRPANLRGLPPDSTLILVNGKRRHRSAVIAFLGGGISDGSQGPDISVIPSVALQQVEVLRDGAAAQYGSDAIAGVLNFQLKDSDSGGYVEVSNGQYYDGDGNAFQLSANKGMQLTEKGFLNLSFEYKQADPTSRSVQRTDAAGLIAAGNTNVADPAQIWGAPEIKEDYKIFFNSGVEVNDNSEVYAFGNYAQREVEGGFFFRNPLTRRGVFGAYTPDPNDPDADDIYLGVLVGNLNPNTATCPTAIPLGPSGLPDAGALAAVEANPNCFTFYSQFPGGFTPRFGGVVTDRSIVAGYRGEDENGFAYDFSVSYGKNDVEFAIKNTINAAFGPNTPTEFTPGSYIQEEVGANFDVSYPLDNGNIAAGVETRRDTFDIIAGDAASYTFNTDLAAQGFGIGSNGFPGFRPEDEGARDRSHWAAYVDVELDLTDSFLLTLATRFEDYEDFGFTENAKISGRWQYTDTLAFRGAFSTGFRAPTVGQANVRNVSTVFGANGLEDRATLPPTNPISVQLGATPLEPELSKNFSVGAVYEADDLFMTVDYYRIKVEDRISQSSSIALTPADIAALLAQGVTDASSFSAIRFFTNDFDTTTQGVDLVVNYSMEMWGGDVDFGVIYNWTDTEVNRFNAQNISLTRVRLLEEGLPDVRATLSMNYTNDAWRVTARYNHYHGFYEDHLDSEVFPIEVDSAATVDLEIGYDVNEDIDIVFGAQNIFDEFPEDNPWAGEAGAAYPVTSPMGFNGGYYYFRLGYSF